MKRNDNILFTHLGRIEACKLLRPLNVTPIDNGFCLDEKKFLSDYNALFIISQSQTTAQPQSKACSKNPEIIIHYPEEFEIDKDLGHTLRTRLRVEHIMELSPIEPVFTELDLVKQVHFIPQRIHFKSQMWTDISEISKKLSELSYTPLGVRFMIAILKNSDALQWLHANGIRRLFFLGTEVNGKFEHYLKLTSKKVYSPDWKIGLQFGRGIAKGGFYIPVVNTTLIKSTNSSDANPSQ